MEIGGGGGRDRWGTRSAFILAAIGSAVGLGNLWRYPHVAYNAGGGAFLIPYFIALFTAGIPLLILEFGVGHRMQGSAPASMARINRKLEFPGWWAAMGGTLITFYYTIIMAWCAFYLYQMIVVLVTGPEVLPWDAVAGGAGAYLETTVATGNPAQAATEGDLSSMNWPAIGFNALMWAAIYYCIRSGVHSVGKVVWVTVMMPYVLLLVLFFTAIQLPGASAGLSYYLNPDWSKFTDPETGALSFGRIADVASAAYGQIFFSLSIGFGIMMAYASYLPKKSDVSNNAAITAFANSASEFFPGIITFCVLGSLAVGSGRFTGDIVGESSFGIAFVTYPEAISQITDSVRTNAAIGVAFFACLLFLGIDSAFSLVEAMIAGITDKFNVSRRAVLIGICTLGFTVGLVFCTPGGLPLLDVADHYLGHLLLVIGIVQCVAVGWVYGPKKMRGHINAVSERRITPFWDFCIKYLTPAVLVFLLAHALNKDLAFLWSADAKPYGKLQWYTQLFGLGAVALALTVAIVLTLKKPTKPDFYTPPEGSHD